MTEPMSQLDMNPSGGHSSQSSIRTRDLSIRFGNRFALKQINLDIAKGSVFALIGANGAGKTTLIRALLGILRQTSGEVNVLGHAPSKPFKAQFEQIGYVSENQELPLWMTVGYFLKYVRGLHSKWDFTRQQQLLSEFRIPNDQKLRHLSRGQLMKVALLSALCHEPNLIILDEPFSGLDPLARDEFICGLQKQRLSSGKDLSTIILSSHDFGEIDGFATHLGYLSEGTLIFSEEISDLKQRFAKIVVTFAGAFSYADFRTDPEFDAFPKSWLVLELASNEARFVHTNMKSESLREQVEIVFPSVIDIQIYPMDLRSIFLALTKYHHLQSDRA